uniref:Amine oxidase domain-containing protein n=1 Tax=Nothobranchius furzeri TaxID=105023 RepID=A0A8C6LIY0_NOTFU
MFFFIFTSEIMCKGLVCKIWLDVAACIVFPRLSSAVHMKSTLESCLVDTDYEELLTISRNGLPKTTKPQKVAVVGAGMAGLTAAKLLQDAGHEVHIYEVSDRVGGRVITHRNETEGWYVELGAMRIPILRSLIHKLHLPLNEFNMTDDNTYYHVNGRKHRTSDVKKSISLLNYDLTENEKSATPDKLLQRSLNQVKMVVEAQGCEAALNMFDGYSVKGYLEEKRVLSREAMRMLGDLLNEDGIMAMALTEMIYLESDVSDNVKYSEVTGGMDRIPTALSKTLRNNSITFNSKVRSIRQAEDGQVTLEVQSDTNGDVQSFTADSVLVTTSAKAALFIDFQPPLSTPKMEAMKSIHYGSSTKIVLTFSERFWEKEGIYRGKSITDRPSRFIYYPSHSFPHNDKIGVLLASYTWGEDSLLFMGLSDEQFLCTGVVVKKWSEDPHSLGAFALFTPYQHLEYAKELFSREGNVHFAGEHTAFAHAWIETAMKSAIRAAKNINEGAGVGSEEGSVRDEL